MTPRELVKAHQYLYAVLGDPVWSDFEYDVFCRRHGIDGGLSSDRVEDYSVEDRARAARERENPTDPKLVFWDQIPAIGDLFARAENLENRAEALRKQARALRKAKEGLFEP